MLRLHHSQKQRLASVASGAGCFGSPLTVQACLPLESTRRLPMNCFQRGKQSCASNTTSPSGYLDFRRDLFKGPQRVELQRADVISEIDQIIAKLPPAQRKMVLARAGRELMIAEERRRLFPIAGARGSAPAPHELFGK